ncbi:hypothetical protein BGZ73_007602 [Actinomortierella ambigua]|nr:hypothetical protein BGZ73_007602 [Actinomortierella ambigua]
MATPSDMHQHIATVLLIGPAGAGKRSLAAAIRDAGAGATKDTVKLHFRTAEVPPLTNNHDLSPGLDSGLSKGTKTMGIFPDPLTVSQNQEEDDEKRGSFRYDIILIIVDMTNKKSWIDCQKSLRHLEPSWFLGHCALVVTKVDQTAHYAFDREDIEDFVADFYEFPIFWANLQDQQELADVAMGSLRLLSVATGLYLTGAEEPSRRSRKPFLPPTVSYSFTRTPDFYHTVSTVIHHGHAENEEGPLS